MKIESITSQTTPSPRNQQNATILNNQYRLESLIGRGSQSLIYSAHNLKTQKRVAIKRFQEGMYSDALKELSLIQGLRHENIVRIHEVFVDEVLHCTRNDLDEDSPSESTWSSDSYYSSTSSPPSQHSTTSTLNIVMDFYPMGDLFKWRSSYVHSAPGASTCQPQYLPESFILRFLSTMVSVLQQLEKERIIHRDLKAENILVKCNALGHQYSLDDIQFIVADFGLSTRYSHPDSLKTSLAGSDHCIAPEIKLMQPYSSAVDKFSLGAILYWLTCGKVAPLYLQLLSEYSNLYQDQIRRDILQHYSDSLAGVILSLLSVQPEKRPSLDALHQAIYGKVVKVQLTPPAPKYRCAVIGAGSLGRDIAGELARLQCEVRIFDVDLEALQAARDHIHSRFMRFIETHVLAKENIEWLMSRVILSKTLADAVHNVDIVVEAIPESLDMKRYLFEHLDKLVDPEKTIITSNSVSWTTDEIGCGVMRQELLAKSIGLRFLFPVYFFSIVEYTRSISTVDDTEAKIRAFVLCLQKETYQIPLEAKKLTINIFNPSPLTQSPITGYSKPRCPDGDQCNNTSQYHRLAFLHQS